MDAITTKLWCHEQFRQISCYLCGSIWEEQFVGVALCEGREAIGSVCPRCLHRAPAEAAAWIGDYARSLNEAITGLGEVLSESPVSRCPTTIDEFRTEIARVKRTAAQLRWMSVLLRHGTAELPLRLAHIRGELGRVWRESRERLRSPAQVIPGCEGGAVPAHEFRSVAELDREANRAQGLLVVAEELATLTWWPVTIEDAIEIERDRFQQRFHGLREEELRRIVDQRYESFVSMPI